MHSHQNTANSSAAAKLPAVQRRAAAPFAACVRLATAAAFGIIAAGGCGTDSDNQNPDQTAPTDATDTTDDLKLAGGEVADAAAVDFDQMPDIFVPLCQNDAQCAVEMPNLGQCKIAACDPAVGCKIANAVDASACEGAPCAGASVCKAGVCLALDGASGPPCDDKNPCTTDLCDIASKTCSHTKMADGATCQIAATCAAGTCQFGTCSGTAASPYWDYNLNPDIEGGEAWIWSLKLRNDNSIAVAGGTRFEEPEAGWAYGFWNGVFGDWNPAKGSVTPIWSDSQEWKPGSPPAGQYQSSSAVIALADGGLAFVGTSIDDARLYKRDAGGVKVFGRSYGLAISTESAWGVAELAGGGFVLVGSYAATAQAVKGDQASPWFLRVDKDGNQPLDSDGKPNAAILPLGKVRGVVRAVLAEKDSVVLCGRQGGGEGVKDYAQVWLGRTDLDGKLVKTLYAGKGIGGFDQSAVAMAAVPEGGFVLAGDVVVGKIAMVDNHDALLVRVDADGKHLWHKIWGGTARDQFTAVQYVPADFPDGAGFIATGFHAADNTANPDAWLVRTDLKGNILWQKNYGGPDWDVAYDVALLPPAYPGGVGFLLGGSTVSKVLATKVKVGAPDAWLVRVGPHGETRCDGQTWCTAENVVDCHDKNPCTADTCNPDNGLCSHTTDPTRKGCKK